MYELSENIGEILEEIEESRNRGSYSMYLSQGGRLKEMDFEKVLGYQPTDANINEVTTLFPHMSYYLPSFLCLTFYNSAVLTYQ